MLAILGMIPLAGSLFWGPMAITIMGGLFVATILTLLVPLALYSLWFRVRENEPQPVAGSDEAMETLDPHSHTFGLPQNDTPQRDGDSESDPRTSSPLSGTNARGDLSDPIVEGGPTRSIRKSCAPC